MEPFQPRRSGTQIKRKRPATEDDFRFGKKAITFLAASRARGVWRQVADSGEGRPRFANFAVIPASGVSQLDRWVNCLNSRSILSADAFDAQDLDPLHRRIPYRSRGQNTNQSAQYASAILQASQAQLSDCRRVAIY
jgi:hypothetical protein